MKVDKPHILKPSKTKPLPTRFIFLDTETDVRPLTDSSKIHTLKLGVAQFYKRVGEFDIELQDELVFYNKRGLYAWLDPLLVGKQTFYIIAHNVPYDAMIIDAFRRLPGLGFEMKGLYSKGQVTIIRWQRDDTRVTFLDNGNFFGGTLERWGKIFGYPKLSVDFETVSIEDLVTYCRRDVEIMVTSWRAWLRFLIEHDCGGFSVTVGSTAFNTWRHKYMPEGVYVHKEREVLDLERRAYHGGRAECFYQGTLRGDHYYYVDINNQYGYVMEGGRYPAGLQGFMKDPPTSRMITYLSRYNVIAHVRVNVDVPAFVTKVNGFTAYPLGRFDVTLTTDELILALQNGWLEKVYKMAWYKSARLFSGYVNEFYPLRLKYREANNEGFAQICKLFVNSLYGKFGQTGLNQVVIGKAPYDRIWLEPVYNFDNGKRSRKFAIGGVIFEEFQEGESFHSMPAVAAHVTANARLYLLTLIHRAGWENVFYTDTDSLIVNQAGYDRLDGFFDPFALGKLKVELESDYVTIHAPKEYEMKGRSRRKGIRASAVEIGPGVFEQEKWPKLAGQMREGMPVRYITETVTKHQARRIRSGVVSSQGWVDPFRLD